MILAFDIDGTLCQINEPVESQMQKILQRLSMKHRIVLASGKPASYIVGLCRQLGLKNASVIGENGGSVMSSAQFPPEWFNKYEPPIAAKEKLEDIKNSIIDNFGETVWFQPNQVNLTVFPLEEKNISSLHDYAKTFGHEGLTIYYHKDSVDFVPVGFDKRTALTKLLDYLGENNQNLVAFGDGSNDIPMFELAAKSYIVGNLNLADRNVNDITYLESPNALVSCLKNDFLRGTNPNHKG